MKHVDLLDSIKQNGIIQNGFLIDVQVNLYSDNVKVKLTHRLFNVWVDVSLNIKSNTGRIVYLFLTRNKLCHTAALSEFNTVEELIEQISTLLAFNVFNPPMEYLL